MSWKFDKQILYMAIAIIATSFFISCGEENGDIDGIGSEEKAKDITPIELLPRDNDISGWMRDGTFSEATNYASLYDLIDGAAQRFIDNGFVSAVFQNYRDASGLQLELRIYDMDSDENARRVYDELAPASIIPWIDIVDAGRIDNSALAAYSVEFQYEHIFVQDIIHEKSDRSLEIAKMFASHVIDLMKLGR
ncbi:TPA: hypothetical protein EYP66_03000 [Candidatus Poribacteria bacterium]|nr:hypothetical protein [Candidatus Poribacteria bacterium]